MSYFEREKERLCPGGTLTSWRPQVDPLEVDVDVPIDVKGFTSRTATATLFLYSYLIGNAPRTK